MDAADSMANAPASGFRSLSEISHLNPQRRALVCVGMSFIAGLSTTLGAAVVLLMPGNKVSDAQMAFVLSLAGSVMITATVFEFWVPLLQNFDLQDLARVLLYSLLGAVVFLMLSRLVPEVEGHGHSHGQGDKLSDEEDCKDCEMATLTPEIIGRPLPPKALHGSKPQGDDFDRNRETERARGWRLALVLMLTLTAHNFPEGFAVAVSALDSDRLGLIVMLAIAMHNIPEGIAISVPVLVATGDRRKAVWMTFASGMAEPLGAVVALGMVGVTGDLSSSSMENLLCGVGGTMVAVAAKELYPEALRQRKFSSVAAGTLVGLILMVFTIFSGA